MPRARIVDETMTRNARSGILRRIRSPAIVPARPPAVAGATSGHVAASGRETAGRQTCVTSASPPRCESGVVVERELERMRPQAQRVDFLRALVLEPGFDDVLGEDVALQENS